MEKVLSSHVGVKINEWYKMIRQFSVPDAEILKAEVEWELDRMEEDQDLLIYYQLMCFRHQLMLDYIKPSFDQSISALVDKIENANHQLSGMLQYYNAFLEVCMNSVRKSMYRPFNIIRLLRGSWRLL